MKETKRIIKALSKKQTYAITSALLLASGLGTGFYNATQDTVTLTIDGETKTIQTHVKDIASLLEQENITVTDGDQLSQPLDTEIEDGLNVDLFTEKEITIRIGNTLKKVYTTGLVVKDAIETAGYTIKEHDKLSHSTDDILEDGTTISYDPAFEVTLKDGTETKKVWTTTTTVSTFLKNQNIELSEYDELSSEQFDLIEANTELTIDRIEKETKTVEEEIEFETVEKKDYSLEKGKTRIVTKGENGVVKKEYEVTYVNGEQKEKELVSEKVVTKSTKQVVAVGAKEAVTTLSSRSSSSTSTSASTSEKSGKEFYVEATAYTPYCAGCSGITATGIDIRSNPNMKLIAVDPSVIPLGSKVYVEGYGYAVAGDTGGAIKGNKIDLLMSTKSEAYSWGRKTVKVRIVN